MDLATVLLLLYKVAKVQMKTLNIIFSNNYNDDTQFAITLWISKNTNEPKKNRRGEKNKKRG